ncbi:hypothetical protein Leryth_001468 [Lithospermum erythrorhizon]|nr:hypothetical protein Leryth_001468 [Lithospermum erythrorhizon]
MKAHHQVLILAFIFSLLSLLFQTSLSQGECSPTGPFCQQGYCCSKYGYCGYTDAYCGKDCQSQCPDSPPLSPPPPPGPSPPPPPPSPPSPPGGDDLSSLITKDMFEEMLKNRNDPRCGAVGFYTYDGFIAAAKLYPEFGNVGDIETRKKEIAAFFGQTSHETTGGWPGADNGGEYAWGYCWKEERDPTSDYCATSIQYPCVPGKTYIGRGPMQLSWNYNYGPFGDSIGVDLLSNPELVSSDDTIAFEAALWFWMTPQAPKPSCHDVIVGKWIPTPCDISENRLPGYGVTTNIINGGLECARRKPELVKNRIGFYSRYSDMYVIGYGDHLDCADQIPFSESSCLGSSNLQLASS